MRLELKPIVAPIQPAEGDSHHTNNGASESRDALQAGIKAAQSGDRTRARAALLHAVELDPKCENGWMWLASISEFPEELLAFLGRVLEINPLNEKAIEWMAATKSLMAKTFVQRGLDAFEEGRRDFASECFTKALEFDHRNAAAWLWLAKLSESDVQRVSLLEKLLSIEPTNREGLKALVQAKEAINDRMLEDAKSAALGGDRDTALGKLNCLLTSKPECTDGWLLKSHLVDGFDEKIQCFESVLSYDPENIAASSGREMLVALVNTKSSDPSLVEAPEPTTVENSEEEIEMEYPPAPDAEIQAYVSHHPSESEPVFAAEAYQPENGWADHGSDVPDVSVPHFTIEEIAAETLEAAPILELDGTVAVECVDENSTAETKSAPRIRSGESSICPYCRSANDVQAVACGSCKSVLTLSDLEMLLSSQKADRSVVALAVAQMENARTERDFSEAELTVLGIGHLNLRNFESGYSCLFDASQLNPTNVVLERQVNSLLIRLEEIREQEEAHGQMAKGKTILVVDDSPTVRKLIAGKLEKCGHEVYCSNDGVEAMDYLKNLAPDLILLDITMPRMDGYQVCKLIRGNPTTKDVPIVMISGKDGFFDKVRGRMAGATGYITKPFGPETLMKAVEHYLSGEVQEFEQ